MGQSTHSPREGQVKKHQKGIQGTAEIKRFLPSQSSSINDMGEDTHESRNGLKVKTSSLERKQGAGEDGKGKKYNGNSVARKVGVLDVEIGGKLTNGGANRSCQTYSYAEPLKKRHGSVKQEGTVSF